jgi:hypothetical protein
VVPCKKTCTYFSSHQLDPHYCTNYV